MVPGLAKMSASAVSAQGVEPAAKRPRFEPQAHAGPHGSWQAPSEEAVQACAASVAETAQNNGFLSTPDASHSLPERICDAVLQHWEWMGKTGKPQPHEHTCMAAFVVEPPPPHQPGSAETAGSPGSGDPDLSSTGSVLTVVAVGTGMKCLSADARCAAGRLMNDSHAEIIARRALQRWIYAQLTALAVAHAASSCGHGSESASTPQDGGQAEAEGNFFVLMPSTAAAGCPCARLRPGCRLHMWVSQAPCGDASIVEADAEPAASCDGTAASETASSSAARRTGAKLLRMPALAGEPVTVPGAADVEAEAEPQRLSAVRRKPGRGAATLSMSCSDKLTRWSLLGVQV